MMRAKSCSFQVRNKVGEHHRQFIRLSFKEVIVVCSLVLTEQLLLQRVNATYSKGSGSRITRSRSTETKPVRSCHKDRTALAMAGQTVTTSTGDGSPRGASFRGSTGSRFWSSCGGRQSPSSATLSRGTNTKPSCAHCGR